jgi:hypothetical protein
VPLPFQLQEESARVQGRRAMSVSPGKCGSGVDSRPPWGQRSGPGGQVSQARYGHHPDPYYDDSATAGPRRPTTQSGRHPVVGPLYNRDRRHRQGDNAGSCVQLAISRAARPACASHGPVAAKPDGAKGRSGDLSQSRESAGCH